MVLRFLGHAASGVADGCHHIIAWTDSMTLSAVLCVAGHVSGFYGDLADAFYAISCVDAQVCQNLASLGWGHLVV